MAPNGSQRLPTAPYDYKHTLLLFSSSMTPTDFHLLPPRELTPQPYSKALRIAYDIIEKKAVSEYFREQNPNQRGASKKPITMSDFFMDYFYRRYGSVRWPLTWM